MASTYKLDLIFQGRDRVSGVIGGITGSFSRLGSIMGGIIGARMLFGIANGIKDIGVSAIAATASVQRMEITLQSLLGREYITQVLNDGTDSLTRFDMQLGNVGDTMTNVWGSTRQVDIYGQAIAAVTPEAKRLMESLASYAILSPYTYESTTQTFRQAMAFGFAASEAEDFTKATLNMAAGIGADNSMLDRMAYNLAQVRLQGKVTKLDIRQLALAGFDLRGVLKYVGDQMGVTVKDHLDFNKAIEAGTITWQDFSRLYAQYAETYFGGASEKLARTLFGLKSTFQDVFALTMPKILGPASEVVTDFLNKILDTFISLRESGVLEQIGADWAESTRKWVVTLDTYWERLQSFQSFLDRGFSLSAALDMSNLVSADVATAIETIAGKVSELATKFAELKASLPEIDFWNLLGEAIIYVADNFDRIAQVFALLSTLKIISILVGIAGAIVSLGAAIATPLALIGIAAALLYTAWTENWGNIQGKLAEAWASMQPTFEAIKDVFNDVWTYIQPLLQQLGDEFGKHLPGLIQAGMAIFNAIGPVFKSMFAAIAPSIQRLLVVIQDVWPQVVANFGFALEFFKYFGLIIAGVIGFVIGIIAGLVNGIISAVTAVWQGLLTVQEGIISVFRGIGEIVRGFIQLIIGIFTGDLKTPAEALVMIFTGLGDVIMGLFQIIAGNIGMVLGFIVGLVGGFVEGVIGFFTSLYNQLVGHSIIPDLVYGIIDFFQQLYDFVIETLNAGLEALFNILNNIATSMSETVKNAVEILKAGLGKLWSEGERVRILFAQGLASAVQRVREKIIFLMNKVLELIAALGRIIIPDALQQHSPSPLEQSFTDSAQALNNLLGNMKEFNGIKMNVPQGSLAFANAATSAGQAGPSELQEPQKVINFYFRDTILDKSELIRALNTVQDV